MKVEEVVREQRRERLSPLKRRVLGYLEAHPDEVFTYRDTVLVEALGVKPSALGFTLWALRRDGFISAHRVGRRLYFGSHRAVAALQARLGQGE